TRNAVGAGEAWYVSTALAPEGLRAVLDKVAPPPVLEDLPEDVEVVRRVSPGAGSEGGSGDGTAAEPGVSFLIAVNHGGQEAEVPASGVDCVSGERVGG